MQQRFLLTLIAALALGSGLHAQVQVQINGDQQFVIGPNNGLYFSNDTMRVDDAVFPLDEISVITLTPVTQGIDNADPSAPQVYPNPARETVTLSGIGATPQVVTLYSTAGVKLMERTAADGATLDISHLPEGLYLLRCADRVAKIVKQL